MLRWPELTSGACPSSDVAVVLRRIFARRRPWGVHQAGTMMV